MFFHGKTQETENDRVDRFLIWCALAVFAVIAVFSIAFVPMNMDEAGIFHAIACLDHPFAKYNLFRETCFVKNDLTFWGGFTLLRPQFYTGLFHSLLYLPFYKIFHAQAGQYAFGLIFLFGFAFLTAKQTQAKALAFALTLAFFPFTFQFIHDTGPVKYVLFLFPLTALWLQKMMDKGNPARLGYALLLPMAFFLATEEKAFFLYLLPSLCLFALALAGASKPRAALTQALRESKYLIGASVLGFTLLTAMLLSATNSAGTPYILWLMKLVGNKASLADTLLHSVRYLLYWPSFAHNYFDLNASMAGTFILGACTLLFVACFTFWVPRFSSIDKGKGTMPLLLAASFVSTLLVFLVFGNAWAGHHFIYLCVPAFFFFVTQVTHWPARPRLIAVMAFLLLNAASLLPLTQAPFLTKVDPEKEVILSYLGDDKRAATSIYNFTTWGAYYIQALYGPKSQMAVYTEPYEPQPLVALYPAYAVQILEMAQTTGRRIYTICSAPSFCTTKEVEAAFGGKLAFQEVLTGLEKWHLYVAEPVDLSKPAS